MQLRGVLLLAAALGVLQLAACGNSAPAAPPPTRTAAFDAARQGPTTPAAALRVRWVLLLEEHQLLAARTTGALIGGHVDEAAAYEDQLNRNGTDIGDLAATSFDAQARDHFDAVWLPHLRALTDAARATVTGNAAARHSAATQETTHFAPGLAALLATLTGRPRDTLARAAAQLASDTQAITAQQAAGDYAGANARLSISRSRLGQLADLIVTAAVARRPATFPGDPASRAAGLDVELNLRLQEHAYELTAATDALLGGRTDELAVASRTLAATTDDLGRVIGGVLGSEAQRRFARLWTATDGSLLDYARAAGGGDVDGEQRALQALSQLNVPRLATLLADLVGASSAGLTQWLNDQVAALIAVVDAQAAQHADAAQRDRTAAARTTLLADRLAEAITTRAPARFA